MSDLTLAQWQHKAAHLTLPSQAFIDGSYRDAVNGATFDCINPANGQLLTKVASCDAADAELAVQAARAAFTDKRWSGLAPKQRKQIMQRFAELMRLNKVELALLESLDMGKPIGDAMGYDAPAAANCIAWNAEAIDKIYDQVAPVEESALALVTREALGVVAAIVPWNFPLVMACWKLGPALATGNSVILKPSEKSPSPPCASPASRKRRASRMESSTCCQALATQWVRRWPCTWTWTASPSPAPPRSASIWCSAPANRT